MSKYVVQTVYLFLFGSRSCAKGGYSTRENEKFSKCRYSLATSSCLTESNTQTRIYHPKSRVGKDYHSP